MPQMIGFCASRARRIRAASSLRLCTARMFGRLRRKSLSEALSFTGLAKSSSETLLGREASGYVLTSRNSNGLSWSSYIDIGVSELFREALQGQPGP